MVWRQLASVAWAAGSVATVCGLSHAAIVERAQAIWMMPMGTPSRGWSCRAKE
ncbi:MAG: hypothetical protein BWX86_01834 [Verrucomicrobia bacterium ADurb.Bin122]|nr:MAG: hypothetical protein BWX86_01834 [Verrucomicrobia bacterium ADurb.Bin122]